MNCRTRKTRPWRRAPLHTAAAWVRDEAVRRTPLLAELRIALVALGRTPLWPGTTVRAGQGLPGQWPGSAPQPDQPARSPADADES